MKFIRTNRGFTLAEILITLGVIGIVAAMTLPGLVLNYERHATAVKVKKMYNITDNAFRLAMANDGVDKLEDTTFFKAFKKSYIDNMSVAEKQELEKELKKVFKFTNSCYKNKPNSGSCISKFETFKKIDNTNNFYVASYTPFVMMFPDGTAIGIDAYLGTTNSSVVNFIFYTRIPGEVKNSRALKPLIDNRDRFEFKYYMCDKCGPKPNRGRRLITYDISIYSPSEGAVCEESILTSGWKIQKDKCKW